jgi:hypothetical protein
VLLSPLWDQNLSTLDRLIRLHARSTVFARQGGAGPGLDLFVPMFATGGLLGGVDGQHEQGGGEGTGMDLFCPQFRHMARCEGLAG